MAARKRSSNGRFALSKIARGAAARDRFTRLAKGRPTRRTYVERPRYTVAGGGTVSRGGRGFVKPRSVSGKVRSTNKARASSGDRMSGVRTN